VTWHQELQISAQNQAEIGLGSSKSANANFHTWMQANGKLDGVTPETKSKKVMLANRTKLMPDPLHAADGGMSSASLWQGEFSL
jgi:hypothetical protein